MGVGGDPLVGALETAFARFAPGSRIATVTDCDSEWRTHPAAPIVRPMPHAHVNAASLAVIIATVVVVNFLIRTWAGHHADNPAAKAAAYIF